MRRSARAAVLWRGIWLRRGLSLGIFLMAVVAVAAASIGASYHGAAATQALRETLAQAPGTSRGMQLTVLNPNIPAVFADELGNRAQVAASGAEDLFGRPIREVEVRAVDSGPGRLNLSWRENACPHLTLVAGRCPSVPHEVVASKAAAAARGWQPGSRIPTRLRDLDGDPVRLTVTGVYTPKDTREDFWFGNPYFPSTDPAGPARQDLDQLFTVLGTVQEIHVAPGPTGETMIGRVLLPLRGDLLAADTAALGESIRTVSGYAERQQPPLAFSSTLTRTVKDAEDAQRALAVPILVTSIQLVVLCWLLLFLVFTDVAQARAPDIALVKLRGLTGPRLLAFGLAEPLTLLLLALPAGVLAGRAATQAMARALFSSHPPVTFPALGWAAACGAAAGGVGAAVLASRGTLTIPVTEQWRRTARTPARRGWIPEAVVLTLVAGGLVQIVGTGVLASDRQGAVSLLVPGLAALGAALAGARLLPIGCRMLYARTRRRGGIAVFLALRQIARRPGGTRITVALATSFALVVFAVAAWSVARTNQREVARTQVGGPTALTVTLPSGQSLDDVVKRADPTGKGAAAVRVTKPGLDDVPITIAVDPERFASVAYWRPDFAATPLPRMLARLHVPAPPPVLLRGDRLGVTVDVAGLKPANGVGVHVAYTEPGRPVPTELKVGELSRPGRVRLTVRLPRCAAGCELRRIFFKYGVAAVPPVVHGIVTIQELRERQPSTGRWRPVDAGLADPDRWRALKIRDDWENSAQASAGPGGLRTTFDADLGLWPGVEPATYPAELNAIVTPGIGDEPPIGLNGLKLPYTTTFRARALPGVTGAAVMVDQRQAHRSAGSYAAHLVDHRIWVTPAAEPRVRAEIRAAGMRILAERRAGEVAERLRRTGPGLALALLLAAAAATALLATAGGMLGLYTFARRRTYELAALSVAGARRRVLLRSLVLEQAVVLGFGALIGIGTGLAVSWLALPSVPQFPRVPAAPPLLYWPDGLLLSGVIAATLAVVLAGAWLMSLSIMSRVRADQLREAPP